MKTSYAQWLVHIDASAQASARLKFASALAKADGAAVTGLYAATSAQMGMAYAPEAGPEVIRALIELDALNVAHARAAFDAAQASAPTRAGWAEIKDAPTVSAFVQQAFFADLLVMGQPDPSRKAQQHVPADFVESVVVACGKPALVIPYIGVSTNLDRAAVIAWKPTRETARAVAAALPLLQRARAVHVVSWDAEVFPVDGGLDLASFLKAHGIEASFHPQGKEVSDIGEMLLSRAYDLQADLLVMGCYGHSRAREWVLGGVSRTILSAMTLPVLMAH